MTPNNEYLCCENVAQRRASEYMQPNWDNLLGPLCVPLVDRFVNLLKDIHVTSWYVTASFMITFGRMPILRRSLTELRNGVMPYLAKHKSSIFQFLTDKQYYMND